jgi:putative transposase
MTGQIPRPLGHQSDQKEREFDTPHDCSGVVHSGYSSNWLTTANMKYDPENHHRRSIRLKGYDYSSAGSYFITICTYQRECLFGEISNGEMQLNQYGQIVQLHWQNLPKYHPRLQLDEFVVMPNHMHGILVLKDNRDVFHDRNDGVGAGLVDKFSVEKQKLSAKPAPTVDTGIERDRGISEIIRGFKTFSARRINQIRHKPGIPVWQRNYYEHIVRDESSFQKIRQYIQTNPIAWEIDQLHPNNPSKW